ncbi:MAG: alpha/beta hydrolase fold domain-containing protein, partial [Nocardioidaceae bacterium]|nr:alpha/beta hydrolase fold domain-containing protein [Nocardioidaceae bacterium]
AGVVALSPWLDATLSQPEVADLEASDPMLAESGLRAAGRWWAGDRDPTDRLVSPVDADLRGLPPLDVYVGRNDILRPAVSTFAARADAADADLHVHEVTAMFHVWMTRLIPEGRRTRRELTALIRTRAAAWSGGARVPNRPTREGRQVMTRLLSMVARAVQVVRRRSRPVVEPGPAPTRGGRPLR